MLAFFSDYFQSQLLANAAPPSPTPLLFLTPLLTVQEYVYSWFALDALASLPIDLILWSPVKQ